MKIYLAGERGTISAEGIEQPWAQALGYNAAMHKYVKRRLFSFYYVGFSQGKGGGAGKRLDENKCTAPVAYVKNAGLELFLDSGAFTAFTKNVPIELDEYVEFLKDNTTWDVVSSLDAIGRGEEAAIASYNNFKYLTDRGCKVQPVWHVREPDSWLERYIAEGHDYVMVGGMVPESKAWLYDRLDHLWDRVLTKPDGTPRVKVHGFGLTTPRLMFRYPWWSVDSTTWIMRSMFGGCLFRNGHDLQLVVFSIENPEARKYKSLFYPNMPRDAQRVVDKWLEQYGVTAEQCMKHYGYRDIVNAAVFQSLEDLGAERFKAEQATLFA